MTIRCFIAIELPEAIKKTMTELIADLKKTAADIAWVPTENIHLTLKFLGNTDDSLLPEIKERISKKLSHYNAFYIRIIGVGCFPSEKRPRVLWIGVENSDVLRSMQKDIDAIAGELGCEPEDRPFSPHLTIGRVRSQKGMAEVIRRLLEFRAADFGTVDVQDIHVIKSELKPAGAEHASMAKIPIGARRNDGKGSE